MREKEEILAYKDLIQKVLFDYEEMLRKNYSILNESQLEHIKEMINQAERVYLYGKGSSALALKEMKMRFMRLGIICEVIEDNDMLVWNNLLVDASCLVILLMTDCLFSYYLEDPQRGMYYNQTIIDKEAQSHHHD